MNSKWTLMNYRELKKQIKNAVSELGTVLELKGVVADTSKLPLTGNKKGDVYIVSEDNTEYVWTSDNATGLITDYEELGPVISGSGGGVLIVTDTAGTLDKTWQEIVDADLAVVHIEINSEEDPPPRGSVCPVIYHEIDTKMGDYSIGVLFLEDNSLFVQNYVASSASGYPER